MSSFDTTGKSITGQSANVEKNASNGNSGDSSLSPKASNQTARDVNTPSNPTPVQTTTVAASKAGLPNDPSTISSSPVVTDTYRTDRILGYTDTGLNEGDDTPAYISVETDFGDTPVDTYARFFLQSVAESTQEKYQIVETFTAFYAFFYGQRPPIYRYSGLLLNDERANWMNDFRYLYDNFLRGTAASEISGQVYLTYDKRVVSGYLLSLSVNQDAATDKGVPFSFDMLVVNHELSSFSSDFDSFVSTQSAYLQSLKDKSAAYTASLTKNANSEQSQIKNNALNGLMGMASIKRSTSPVPIPTPPDQKSDTSGPGNPFGQITLPNSPLDPGKSPALSYPSISATTTTSSSTAESASVDAATKTFQSLLSIGK